MPRMPSLSIDPEVRLAQTLIVDAVLDQTALPNGLSSLLDYAGPAEPSRPGIGLDGPRAPDEPIDPPCQVNAAVLSPDTLGAMTPCAGPISDEFTLQRFATRLLSLADARHRAWADAPTNRPPHPGDRHKSRMQRAIELCGPAFAIAQKLQRRDAQLLVAAAGDHDACACVDQFGIILDRNEVFQRLSESHDIVRARATTIDFHCGAANRAFRFWLKLPAKPNRMRFALTSRQSGEQFVCTFNRMSSKSPAWLENSLSCVTIVEITVPLRLDTTLVQQAFMLTTAEAETAALIVEGRSLNNIARIRDVSLHTIRTQLRSLLYKTDTHRQAELVAVLGRFC